jgi:hypothetical protein
MLRDPEDVVIAAEKNTKLGHSVACECVRLRDAEILREIKALPEYGGFDGAMLTREAILEIFQQDPPVPDWFMPWAVAEKHNGLSVRLQQWREVSKRMQFKEQFNDAEHRPELLTLDDNELQEIEIQEIEAVSKSPNAAFPRYMAQQLINHIKATKGTTCPNKH